MSLFFLILFLQFPVYSQWQIDVRLTNDSAISSTSFNNARCIALSGSNVHVVWADNRDGNFEIYYKRSIDGGASWGTDTRLTNNSSLSRYPSVSVSGSVVHIVWEDNLRIYYKYSTNGGVNWGADTPLTSNSVSSYSPSLSVISTVLHVVWYEYLGGGNYEIYYKRSTDEGVSWGADTRLTNNSFESEYPSVSLSDSVVQVVWHDSRDGNNEIYYKRSTDGGVSWGADTRLTNNSFESEYPSVSVSDSVVHVVWHDHRDGPSQIYYKRSTDGGVSWGADTRLMNSSSGAFLPSVSVSGSVVHVVWFDSRDGDQEIYYKRSTDGGVSWGADTRLTNNFGTSQYPSVSVSGSVVHVVWTDYRDGNYEIYYKRDPTGNSVGITNISSEIPKEFFLDQNYPNPFNPSTIIRYSLIKNSFATLKVYDLLGNEVSILVNERQNAGTYEVEFDGNNHSSGIYYYKLETDNFSNTKKMMLLK